MRRGWMIGLVLAAALAVGATSVFRVRLPIAQGVFYPAEGDKLLAAVRMYMDEARTPELPGRYVACVAPHSAYPYSGAVAAHAFRLLKPGQYDRVIILASSHFAWIEGCSIPSVQFYRTPLGDVELDGPAITRLQWCPLIDTRSLTSRKTKRFSDGTTRPPLHEIEYSIETVLPFLQERLGRFKLVPIVVGSFVGREGKPDNEGLKTAARALREIIDDRTFIVVSSDFTHLGHAYGFYPFEPNDQEQLEALDVEGLDLLMHKDLHGFQTYIEETGNRICGEYALQLLTFLLPRGTESVLLDYRRGARTVNDEQTSVSYAAIAFFHRELAPAESHPIAARSLPVPKATVKPPPLLPRKTAAPPKAAGQKKAPVAPEKKGLFRRLRGAEP